MKHDHADRFEPGCPGCRPALCDPVTMKPYPETHPMVITVNRVFDAAPREEREAFYRVCVKNSRTVGDMRLMSELQRKISAALDRNSN